MSTLIIGLILFLGIHSIRIFAESARGTFIANKGPAAYKGLYTVVSLLGFGLIIWGYGLSRAVPVELYSPPLWTRHLASVLMLVSMVLLVCAYVPGTRIKAKLHHPMVISVKIWAFAHLIANGRLADVLLFGAFLVWAVLDLRAAKARDRANAVSYKPGSLGRDTVAIVLGVMAWWAIARWLHAPLIGVAPL